MAYVDIKKVLETAKDGYHSDFEGNMANLTSLREVLEDTPTADVVKVVRCPNCKHSLRVTICCNNVPSAFYRCELGNESCNEDYYCRYGKRKERI